MYLTCYARAGAGWLAVLERDSAGVVQVLVGDRDDTGQQ